MHSLQNKNIFFDIKTMLVQLCDVVSVSKVCYIFMEFGMGILYKKLYTRYEFCEKGLSNRHTLLWSIN